MPRTEMAPSSLYRRWVVANGLSEGLGLATIFIVGDLMAGVIVDIDYDVRAAVAVAVALLLGMLAEGIVVATAQAWVIRSVTAGFPWRPWVVATTLAVGLTWLLDAIGGVVALVAPQLLAGVSREVNPLAFQVLTTVTGATSGLVVGVLQRSVMPATFRRARQWIWANVVAWALAMPLLGAGLSAIPWQGSRLVTWCALFLVCGSAGLMTGGITGVTLIKLVARPASSEPGSHERLAA